MDGVALLFQKEDPTAKLSKATFAAGCFWCEEAVFESIKGVKEAISGYAGGEKENPTYEEVGSGTTGHAESVEVYYDSNLVTYPILLKVYFASMDPTQVNGQGPDHGTPYRSLIFYRNPKEKKLAEDYHQNYVALNPGERYVQMESIPRLRRAQKQFPELVKADKVQQ